MAKGMNDPDRSDCGKKLAPTVPTEPVSAAAEPLRIEENGFSVAAPFRRQITDVLRAVSQKQRGIRNVRVNPFREE
jgi:hypothetical protein